MEESWFFNLFGDGVFDVCVSCVESWLAFPSLTLLF